MLCFRLLKLSGVPLRFLLKKYFGCHGNQSSLWNLILLTTLVELNARNIPAKFQQIWPSGLGGEVVRSNC
jgi:hypothetical protein